MAKCGFSKFVGDSCGQSASSNVTAECITLLECDKDIKPHLRAFKVIDAALGNEMQLIFARAGNYNGTTI